MSLDPLMLAANSSPTSTAHTKHVAHTSTPTPLPTSYEAPAWAIALPILFFFGVPTLVVVITIAIRRKKIRGETQTIERAKRARCERHRLEVDEFIKAGRMSPVKVRQFLQEGEHAYQVEDEVSFKESRAVRNYRGESYSYKKFKTLDSGTLIATNKRLIFSGYHENRSLSLKDIEDFLAFSDVIQISLFSRNKPLAFTVKNPQLWHAVLFFLKTNSQHPPTKASQDSTEVAESSK